MILILWPRTSSAEDNTEAGEAATKSAVEELDGWTPPSQTYAISNIGRNIEQDGVQYKCYTPEEGRSVLLPMFADYRALLRVAWLWMAAKAEFEAMISAANTKLDLFKLQLAFYQDEAENWMNIAKARAQKFELAQKWAWVPWALVVAESLVVGVVGVKAAAAK